MVEIFGLVGRAWERSKSLRLLVKLLSRVEGCKAGAGLRGESPMIPLGGRYGVPRTSREFSEIFGTHVA